MAESSSQVEGFYKKTYEGETSLTARPPWDIGEPQRPFVELERAGAIKGDVLDAGCGSGEMALFLAGAGHSVLGVDISEAAVEHARGRAAERGSTAEFAAGSVLDLAPYAGRFDTVVDCGMFHALSPEDRSTYAAQLRLATRPGARVYILAMSTEARAVVKAKFGAAGVPEKVRAGFPPVVPDDLRGAFAEGWEVESVADSILQVRFPGEQELTDLPAYFGTFRRL
ncbi:class I SAM-dependent methyltransferase [Streptomyces capparidis]